MTGYELPLRAIREQIASAVDLIVHTARLKDGSRKIINITEVYGIEEDKILTQDIFAFEQTGFEDGKILGELPHRRPSDVHGPVQRQWRRAAARRVRDPGRGSRRPGRTARADGARWARRRSGRWPTSPKAGKVVEAGGMVYISAVGPVDPATARSSAGAIKEQTSQASPNLKGKLEASGSSLDKVVWANWSLRDPAEFDTFNEEWISASPATRRSARGR